MKSTIRRCPPDDWENASLPPLREGDLTMRPVDLAQRTILITRPLPEGTATARLVHAWGGSALLAPAMTLAPPADARPLAQAMGDLSRFAGVILTSAHGARAFLDHRPPPAPPPLFAVGPKTAAALHRAGFSPFIPQPPYDAESLAHQMQACFPVPMKEPLLFLRAEEGREVLVQHLREAGMEVEMVAAYGMKPCDELPQAVVRALTQGRVDGVTFFSSRTATSFLSLLAPHGGIDLLKKPLVAALSPITGATLEQSGVRVDIVAQEATAEGILRALAAHWTAQGDPLCPS